MTIVSIGTRGTRVAAGDKSYDGYFGATVADVRVMLTIGINRK